MIIIIKQSIIPYPYLSKEEMKKIKKQYLSKREFRLAEISKQNLNTVKDLTIHYGNLDHHHHHHT